MQNKFIKDGQCNKETMIDGVPTANDIVDLQNSIFLRIDAVQFLQVIKRFHRNQKDVGMAVVNKVHKQGHHYSTLHCPT